MLPSRNRKIPRARIWPKTLRWVITLSLIAVALLMMTDSARAATCSLYTDATPTSNDNFTGNVGTRFTVTGEGVSATGARYYHVAGSEDVLHTLRLWTESGSNLGSTEAGFEDGWNSANFSSPIALSDGVTYVIAVTLEDEDVAGASGTAGTADCGPLTRETTTSGSEFFGRYTTGTGASRPNTGFGTGHYFVDVIVDYDSEDPPPPEEEDATDAQLTWWGIWAIVGLLFVLMIAPPFLRVLDVRHGLGGRFERG